MNSFRLRLALLVGALTAALLLAAGFAAWEFTSRFNLDRLDRELSHLAKTNLDRVNDGSHWARLDAALAFVSGSDRPPTYVIWAKNYDRVEFRSARWPRGIAPEILPVPATYEGGVTFTSPPPPPARGGLSPRNPPLPVRQTAFSTLTAEGSTWRVAVTGNPYTTLVVAANLDGLNLDLRRLLYRYLAALPFVLLVVGAGAWWLASRALRPVVSLTHAAERITAQGLDQRIAAPAHDREFRRLVTVFNAMLDRLETGFHQARRFSADASHELKTPLALLQAELEQALRAAPSGSPSQQTYSSLLDDVQRLKAILEKLLLLSLADSGRLVLDRAPTDLGALLANIVEDSSALAPHLMFETDLPPGVIVSADAILLEQALQNLAGNALKYNRPEGVVRLTVSQRGDSAVITMANTGPGIAEEDRPRIFERFYRGDPARTRDRTSGAGLGLSLSREILRAHGGDLALAPAAAPWTTFVATLPLAPSGK
ncbi:MAG: ATP-binding protein [Verrucomicrobia bacterium]|nr:ATP-binding protein [Verrucomicrobiota bacterium]